MSGLTIDSSTYNANGQTTTVTGLTTVTGATYTGGSGTQTLTGGLSMTGGTLHVDGNRSLGGNVATLASTNTSTISGGTLSLGATRTFTIADGTAADDLVVSSVISGVGFRITKTRPRPAEAHWDKHLHRGHDDQRRDAERRHDRQWRRRRQPPGRLRPPRATWSLAADAAVHRRDCVTTNRGYTLVALTTSAVDITAGATTLTLTAASANTTGALTKVGPGVLLLSGSNAYTGLTTVAAGTLRYGASNVLSNGGVTVDGGTFDIATFSDVVGTVTLVNGSVAGTTGVLDGTSYAVQNGTASAILAGPGALTKATVGTVTLSAVNTYAGATTINAGKLIVAGSTGSASAVTVNSTQAYWVDPGRSAARSP